MPETNRGVDPNHVIDSLGRQVAQHAVEVAKRDAEIARLREQVAELEDDKPTDT